MKRIKQYINEALKIKSGTNIRYNNPDKQYFYHEALEDGYITKFIETKNVLQYSTDECNTWNDLEPDVLTPKINKSERIYFKGKNLEVKNHDGIGIFRSTKEFNVGGNIMSLIYGDDFYDKTELLDNFQFSGLFYNNLRLLSAKNLVLPAIKLKFNCYLEMFFECKNLKEAPELPATSLAENCYMRIFGWCNKLINTPELPATELSDGCYYEMFMYCKNLITSPKLKAKKLAPWCYQGMFYGCNLLNEITMLATDINAKDCLRNFTYKNADNGVFIKTKGANIPTNKTVIPEGWDIKEI